MSRRHLESALVAGALIESGLTPCFRFTRVRFERHIRPPTYSDSAYTDPENSGSTPLNRNVNEDKSNEPINGMSGCSCNQAGASPTQGNGHSDLMATFYDGDCEPLPQPSTEACKKHTEQYLNRRPWRQLTDDYAVHAVQFSPDGKQLLVGSANTSIRVISTADAKQHLLPRPSRWKLGMPITTIRFMPLKSIWAVACNSDGEVFAFRPDHEGFETLFKEPQQTYTLDMAPDGRELATAGVDRRIRIYTLQPGSVLALPDDCLSRCDDSLGENGSQHRAAERGRAYSQEGSPTRRFQFPGGRPNQIVDKTVRPYELTRCYGTGDAAELPDVPRPIAYATSDSCEPPLREYVPTAPAVNITQGHSKRIMALRYHPQKPSLLFSAGWDNLVKLWDTRLQCGPVLQIYGPHVASPDGLDVDDNYLLTASWRARQSIEIWDLRSLHSPSSNVSGTSLSVPSSAVSDHGDGCNTASPAEVIPISGPAWVPTPSMDHGEYPYAARLLPSRALVVAGSGFHEVRVVGRDTLLPIVRVATDSVVQCLDTILDGRYVAAGCSSGTVALIGLA